MKVYKIFNISFIDGDYSTAYKKLKEGGLMIVPSGPGLATIGKDLNYTKAVQNADFAIPDSVFMIILLRLLKGVKIKKMSGYKFLLQFFKEEFIDNDLFLIDPNEQELIINNRYLNGNGISIQKSNHYIAPMYNRKEIKDKKLLDTLNSLKNKPKYIIINLGSNIQEPLGYYLKKNLNFKPSIICTGAAISFLTGTQANILPWGDTLGLGWLWRCISHPTVFIPRYLKALNLFLLIIKADIKVFK